MGRHEVRWSTRCHRPATPTRRLACSSAGRRWSAAGHSPPRRPGTRLSIHTRSSFCMTDGLNTQRPLVPPIRIRSMTARNTPCDNLRTAHVDLYTIQVNTGGDPTSTLLQNCASSPEKFYHAAVRGPDDCDVQHDRYQPDQVARRSISAAPDSASHKQKARLD